MGRIILITGVTRGLGRSLADRFVEQGHTVLGCGRSESHIAALKKRYGSPHDFQALDVADDRQVGQWAVRLLTTTDPPDLLLNNAALMNRPAPLWEVPAAEFGALMDVNLKGVANVIRHFIPAMVRRQSGVIVNFSSGWGRSTSPQVAPYCCTKWGIEGLTQAMSQELPAGMAAVALNPGIIDTDMLRTCWSDGASAYPNAEKWSHGAARLLLSLGPPHNGKALSVR